PPHWRRRRRKARTREWPERRTTLKTPLRLSCVVAIDWRPAEHSGRSPGLHRIKKRNGVLVWHSDTTGRSRVTRQICGVQPVSAVESHKIMHWRWDKLSATRDLHVGVGVRYDGVPVRINNLPIHARVMTALLFQDRKRTRLGQVAVTATRDRRRENQ